MELTLRQLEDVLHAVGDAQRAGGRDLPDVAGVEPAVRVQHLLRLVLLLVVPRERRRPPQADLRRRMAGSLSMSPRFPCCLARSTRSGGLRMAAEAERQTSWVQMVRLSSNWLVPVTTSCGPSSMGMLILGRRGAQWATPRHGVG